MFHKNVDKPRSNTSQALTEIQSLVAKSIKETELALEIHLKVVSGDVKSLILNYASELEPDMLVIGSDSLSSKKSLSK